MKPMCNNIVCNIADNINNNNSTGKKPELFHSMSTQSTTALMDNYTPSDVEAQPISKHFI